MVQMSGESPSIRFIRFPSSDGQSKMPEWNARMCSHCCCEEVSLEIGVVAWGFHVVVLARAGSRRMQSSSIGTVVSELLLPFLELHLLCERQGSVTGLLVQLLSGITASCPVHEYVESRVIAGEGCNIVLSNGDPPSTPCAEISAGQRRMSA